MTTFARSSLIFDLWVKGSASSCYEVTELGYRGADIVLDKNRGPLLLELNARTGLAIQIANGMGMQPRLSLIKGQQGVVRTAEERVAFSMEAFQKTAFN